MKREAVYAGSFYPKNDGVLRREIEGFFKSAKKVNLKGKLRALVVPHAGYMYSGIVAAAGYKLLTNQKKIILIGPSHQAYFRGFAASGSDYWSTPLGDVGVRKEKGFPVLEDAHRYEHSIEVQLPFLQVALKDFEILPISVGDADYRKLAEALLKVVKDDVIVVSSDLSHYHPYNVAVAVDSLANQAVPKLDIEKAKAIEACGKVGILAVMEIATKKKWKGILVDYRNSGDTAGDKGQVVGYGCYAFYGD